MSVRKMFLIACLTAFAVGCKKDAEPEMSSRILVVGKDEGIGSEFKKTLSQANEDIELVLALKIPKYAILESTLLDGGTSAYKADRYRIVVHSKMVNIGDIQGVIFGPTLSMKDQFDNTVEFSYIKFYSSKEFERLQAGSVSK